MWKLNTRFHLVGHHIGFDSRGNFSLTSALLERKLARKKRNVIFVCDDVTSSPFIRWIIVFMATRPKTPMNKLTSLLTVSSYPIAIIYPLYDCFRTEWNWLRFYCRKKRENQPSRSKINEKILPFNWEELYRGKWESTALKVSTGYLLKCHGYQLI